jgi:hypothetical protein
MSNPTSLVDIFFYRFSERKKDHWFQGEKDGISYAGGEFPGTFVFFSDC